MNFPTGWTSHTDRICRKVQDDVLPGSDDSFLQNLYTHLCDNLFPDEAGGHPRSALSEEELRYLDALESILEIPGETFDPLTDLITVEPEQAEDSRVLDEYLRFRERIRAEHVIALFRIGREIQPFDPASHTFGVHNIALHTGMMAKQAGIPVDLPLLSAAALGHDLGKFGCRGDDARRIPYLHYYYTWQWFSTNGMEDIGHVSANHSTWDLEFENLPIESLLLIYADFRVRGIRGEDGKEIMSIYSLSEAYDMIFSKLYNMTPEKQKRYRTVYHKLHDFERFLARSGVPAEILCDSLGETFRTDASLQNAGEALESLCTKALEGSIRLMHTVSTEQSFDQILERAKGEKNLQSIRTYLVLLREYNTYMSTASKKKTLALLYELLMHQDGDVRRTAGEIMGRILANSGPKYRKERPAAAKSDAGIPTILALLDESVSLWETYLDLCLHPDRKISAKHSQRISNSLKIICRNLFSRLSQKEAARMIEPLLDRLSVSSEGERFVLLDALCQIPSRFIPEESMDAVIRCLAETATSGGIELSLTAMRCLGRISREIPDRKEEIRTAVLPLDPESGEYREVLRFARGILLEEACPVSGNEASRIYLSNMKNAVHWMIKLEQIRMLSGHAETHPEEAFHIAMHLSNILSVSEHLPVREAAGEALLQMAGRLTVAQINEITIDLLRELETGQDQISYLIPSYVGKLICLLPQKEMEEAVDYVEQLVRGSALRSAKVALRTAGTILTTLPDADREMTDRTLGVLMTGISHYDNSVHETALSVLCRDVFGDPGFPLERRASCFLRIHKKLLTILSEPREGMLTFFNTSAMMNHLYRFIVQYEVEEGPFRFAPPKPAAFFPGTFDPFSVGHKEIVRSIRALGFEVYLAVDEFSWSKQTLAKLLRRRIVEISVADQWDTYLFPDDIPINIAMPEDLKRLRSLLPDQELYLVAGSDVIRNASAYRGNIPGGAAEYNHILFDRESGRAGDAVPFSQIIRGKLRMLALPPFYESVSSTRIRESIDRRLDISMLVDPVVQSFIYQYNLYVRSPEQKEILSRQDLHYAVTRAPEAGLPDSTGRNQHGKQESVSVQLIFRSDRVMGRAAGHTLPASELLEVLKTPQDAAYIRRHSSGQILLIDTAEALEAVETKTETLRMVLNELLARTVESGVAYALCRCGEKSSDLGKALLQLGFLPTVPDPDIYMVDMRSPVMLLQDVFLRIKPPHRHSEAVRRTVAGTRLKLRKAICGMFPGKLLLCFDSEMLNQALMERVERINGVQDVPHGERRLGPYMCVPYGKILSNEIVPNTVTKMLHAEKRFRPDIHEFEIVEYPDYSPLKNQVRVLKSFRRPIILVDDLLHNGYRMEKLDRVFREEEASVDRLVVAVMSAYGQDLMRVQGHSVECEYFIPNLHYWLTEGTLYPFLGGDSVSGRKSEEHMLPSVNLILPYVYPNFIYDAEDARIREFSMTALENAQQILRSLEQEHQRVFSTHLTIRRLNEVLLQPRVPDKGSCMNYDFDLPASVYLEDDLSQARRILRKEGYRDRM